MLNFVRKTHMTWAYTHLWPNKLVISDAAIRIIHFPRMCYTLTLIGGKIHMKMSESLCVMCGVRWSIRSVSLCCVFRVVSVGGIDLTRTLLMSVDGDDDGSGDKITNLISTTSAQAKCLIVLRQSVKIHFLDWLSFADTCNRQTNFLYNNWFEHNVCPLEQWRWNKNN